MSILLQSLAEKIIFTTEISIILSMIRTHFVYNTGQGAFPLHKTAKADKLKPILSKDSLSSPFAASLPSKSTYLTVDLKSREQ